jgi:hypothetical protein
MRTRTSLLLATLLLVGLLPGAAPAGEAVLEPVSQTDNLEHVAQVEYPQFRSGSYRATDSDFLEFTAPEGWTPPAWGTLETGLVDPRGEGYLAPAEGETRTFNLMGTRNNGLLITDITDPEQATVVSRWDCGINQADVFVFQQEAEDGDVRQYAAFTLDATATVVAASECATTLSERGRPVSGRKGTFIADVTDPYRPQTVSFLPMAKGTHQVTVHPSGDYVYNSAAVLGSTDVSRIGSIEVYDVSTPAEPRLVTELMLQTGLDSHDMTFSPEGDRLFVAALTHSLVIDTSDPADPQILTRIIDPSINIHHDAHRVSVGTPLGDRDYLLIGDELAGASGTGVCPGGGIHVFDITGPLELAPVKVGAFFIPDVRLTPADVGGVQTCTAHVIQPLPGTTLLVVAWYNGGVRILDYAGLAGLGPVGVSVGVQGATVTPGIQEVAHSRFANSSLWSAKVHQISEDGSFYIFGGDMTRHLDIWKFTPEAAGSSGAGLWLTPRAAARRALDLGGPGLTGGYRPLCLLPSL